jgi:hypothetical protein
MDEAQAWQHTRFGVIWFPAGVFILLCNYNLYTDVLERCVVGGRCRRDLLQPVKKKKLEDSSAPGMAFNIAAMIRGSPNVLEQLVTICPCVMKGGRRMSASEVEMVQRAENQMLSPDFYDIEMPEDFVQVPAGLAEMVPIEAFFIDNNVVGINLIYWCDGRGNIWSRDDDPGSQLRGKLCAPCIFFTREDLGFLRYVPKSAQILGPQFVLANRSDPAFMMMESGAAHDAVACLMQMGLSIDTRCEFRGWSLLHYAVFFKDIDAVEFLIRQGISADCFSSGGGYRLKKEQPTCIAGRGGDILMLRLLFSLGANPNCRQQSTSDEDSLMVAMSGMGLNGQQSPLLVAGVSEGWDPAVIILLVDSGARFDKDSILFHMLADKSTSYGIFLVLAGAGANLNAFNGGETVVCRWIKKHEKTNCSDVLVAARKLGMDMNAVCKGVVPRTPLMYAVNYFNLNHVRTLLNLGADAGIKGEEKKTAGEMLELSTRASSHNGTMRSFRPFYREAEWQLARLPNLPADDVNVALTLLGADRSLEDERALEAKQNALGEAIHSYDDVFSRFSNI